MVMATLLDHQSTQMTHVEMDGRVSTDGVKFTTWSALEML